MNKKSSPASLELWFDYTEVEKRREKQKALKNELEKEFDKVFGEMYNELGLKYE